MATVEIDAPRLESGDLPGVCAKTGLATTRYDETLLAVIPTWQWGLLVLGVYPFYVAKFLSGRAIKCRLPVSDELGSRLARIRRMRSGALLIATFLLAAIITAGAGYLITFALAFLLSAAIATVSEANLWVGVSEDSTKDRWVLTRVDPAFVRAVNGEAAIPPPSDLS